MPQPWRFRESLTEPLSAELIQRRAADGWHAAYVEWVREGAPPHPPAVEPPFGLRLTNDSAWLEESPSEFEVMLGILEGLVRDASLSQIAADLKQRGHTTRSGFAWTPAEVFDLLPRVIEYSRRLFSSPEWHARRAAATAGRAAALPPETPRRSGTQSPRTTEM